jgi:hypothetical protein
MKKAAMLILVVGLVPTTLWAQAASSPKESLESRVDYDSVRRELGDFETAIDDVIRDTFSNPFGLVNKPKGVYLPGYGQVFTFLVNIQRAVIKTPFGEYRTGQTVTPGEKRQRIEDFKDRLVRVLVDNGSKLNQLRPADSIAIVALFEDRNFPDEGNQNRTVVLSVSKNDLDEWSAKPDRWKEFKQRVKIIEY